MEDAAALKTITVDLETQKVTREDGSFFGAFPFGNAILSRQPLTRVDSQILAVSRADLSLGAQTRTDQDLEPRVAVAAVVELPGGGTLGVCCTHLDHISENERAIQAGGLVRQLHDLRGDAKAMLVVGDLNALNDEAKWDRLDAIHEEHGWAPPEDSSVPGGALHTFLENGWVDASRGAGLSSPAKDPVRRVDYVLAHRPVTVKRARTDAGGGDGS